MSRARDDLERACELLLQVIDFWLELDNTPALVWYETHGVKKYVSNPRLGIMSGRDQLESMRYLAIEAAKSALARSRGAA